VGPVVIDVMSRQEISVEGLSRTILSVRNLRVILDSDLAALYGVSTKRLNEQVKRNAARFAEDFMFRLSASETEAFNRSHFAAGSQKHRDPRFPPFAFTEHGAIMAATLLPRMFKLFIGCLLELKGAARLPRLVPASCN
jgi:hypothetical protein